MEKEDAIQNEFIKICGKEKSGNNVCVIDDSDDDSDSDIEPIDGFIGDERSVELESQVGGTEDALHEGVGEDDNIAMGGSSEGTTPVVGV